jgi:hypothetical protein
MNVDSPRFARTRAVSFPEQKVFLTAWSARLCRDILRNALSRYTTTKRMCADSPSVHRSSLKEGAPSAVKQTDADLEIIQQQAE